MEFYLFIFNNGVLCSKSVSYEQKNIPQNLILWNIDTLDNGLFSEIFYSSWSFFLRFLQCSFQRILASRLSS